MGFIRKPTFAVFAAAVVLALMSGIARHNLYLVCPKMEHIPVFSFPAGTEDLDDGVTYESCTDADPNYLEMKKYGYYFEGCCLILVVLVGVDFAASVMSKSQKLTNRQSHLKRQFRKYLTKLSRFMGGI